MPKPGSQIFECLPAYTIKPLSLQAWLVAVVCPGRQGYAHACAYSDDQRRGKVFLPKAAGWLDEFRSERQE